jgi:hypothetical protein
VVGRQRTRLANGLSWQDETGTELNVLKKTGGPALGRRGPLCKSEEGTLDMWVLLSVRLRRWLLMVIALPLARFLVHRLALAADRRDARSARLLHRADSAVAAVSRRTARRTRH